MTDSMSGGKTRLARLAAYGLIVLAVLAAAVNGRYQIALNASASVSDGVLLLRLGGREKYDIGSTVAFSFDGSRWGFPAGTPWAKRVAGVAGETVQIRGGAVLVGSRPVATLHGPTMARRRLSPAAEGMIPEGYLFVTGEHERSFDSRYHEFGLVPVASVFGEAIASM